MTADLIGLYFFKYLMREYGNVVIEIAKISQGGRSILTKLENILEQILEKLQDSLTHEQLSELESTMVIAFHGIEVQEEHTQLVTSERTWEKILRMYCAAKRVENCSERTIKGYSRCIIQFFTQINKKINNITTNDIRYYLAFFQETHHTSIVYLDNIRRYLNSFFTWVADEGYIQSNPMRKLKKMRVPTKLKKTFSAAEMEELRCNANSQRDIAIMEFLYCTATRIGEAVSVNRSDIDWQRKELIVYGEKGKKERTVYLTDRCIYHLRKYLDERKDTNEALFVSSKSPHKRLGVQAIQSMLAALGKKTNIHVHAHKFRRTLLTDAGKRGMPLQEIQVYAGHAKPDTTMQYVMVQQERVKSNFMKNIA